MADTLRRSTGQQPNGEYGFTLLELLVALTVLSLVALVMLGGLKFGARVWDREESMSDQSDSIATAQNLIRRQLAVTYPEWQNNDRDKPHVAFDGEPRSISFLAPPPAQLGPGTNLHYSLETSPNDTLDVVWRASDNGAGSARSTLLHDVASVEFAYYGPQLGAAVSKWSDRWSDRARLPDLIRLRVVFPPGDRRVWPELVVHPDISVDVRCIYEPITRTCRGRPE